VTFNGLIDLNFRPERRGEKVLRRPGELRFWNGRGGGIFGRAKLAARCSGVLRANRARAAESGTFGCVSELRGGRGRAMCGTLADLRASAVPKLRS